MHTRTIQIYQYKTKSVVEADYFRLNRNAANHFIENV